LLKYSKSNFVSSKIPSYYFREKSLVKTAPILQKTNGFPKTVKALPKHLEAGQNKQGFTQSQTVKT